MVAQRPSGVVLLPRLRGLQLYDSGAHASSSKGSAEARTESAEGASEGVRRFLQRGSSKASPRAAFVSKEQFNCARSKASVPLMQVSIKTVDILTADEFFIEERCFTVRLTDKFNRTIKFRTRSKIDDFGNFRIKTRGVYKGGTIATYRLPRSMGDLETLYGIVGEQLGAVLRNLVHRDRTIISRLKRFQTEG